MRSVQANNEIQAYSSKTFDRDVTKAVRESEPYFQQREFVLAQEKRALEFTQLFDIATDNHQAAKEEMKSVESRVLNGGGNDFSPLLQVSLSYCFIA